MSKKYSVETKVIASELVNEELKRLEGTVILDLKISLLPDFIVRTQSEFNYLPCRDMIEKFVEDYLKKVIEDFLNDAESVGTDND